MKKYIFPILTVILICFVVFEKCSDTVSDKAFNTQMDSLNHANDSLKVAIAKDDSVINDLNILDAELNDLVLHQKTKVTTVIKYVESKKNTIDLMHDGEIVSFYNNRYPTDTTSSPIIVAKPVLVASAKDLVELDGAKELIKIKDTIIGLDSSRLVVKDSVISKFKSKEISFKSIIGNQDVQIKGWQKQYNVLKLENTKLKAKSKFQRIASYIIIGGLGYLTLVK
jgi:hypothetical protein